MKKSVGIIRYIFLLLLSLSFVTVDAAAQVTVRFGPEAPPKVVEITFADIPAVTIPLANKPVKLSLPFNEDGWKGSLELDGFSRIRKEAIQIARGLSGSGDAAEFLKESMQPRQKTNVFLTYDNRNLYVGFQCFDDEMQTLSVEPTQKRDSAVWGADCFEAFIAPWKSSAVYYQFVVDNRGTIYDAVNRFYQDEGGRRKTIDKTWNANVNVFAEHYDDFWVVQLKIPFKDIGLTPNDKARMNFCRTERMGMKSEHSSWIMVEESFHETERFAEVNFGRAPPTPPMKVEKITFPDPLWGENGMKIWLKGKGKATIRAELLDAKGKPEDQVSRHIVLQKDEEAGVVYLPYRITEFGKHTILLILADPSGKAVYGQRTLPLATPDLMYIQCPDAFFSTQPSGVAITTLNVSPTSLDEVGLRYTVLSEGKPVAREDVSDVRSRVIYTQIGLEKIRRDVPCQLRVEVMQKASGKLVGRKTVPFRRVPLSW